MTHYQEIVCPDCGSNHLIKAGRSASGVQRYRCDNAECTTKTKASCWNTVTVPVNRVSRHNWQTWS